MGRWSQVLSLRGKKKIEHTARILGGEEFEEQILEEADRRLKRQLQLGRKKDSIDQVIKKLCKEGE